MECILIENFAESPYKEQVFDLLCECDREFTPPLSSRIATTQSNLSLDEESRDSLPLAYFEVMAQQSFILALDDDKVVGFMSYIPRHVCEELHKNDETLYLSTVIVSPEHRGQGIAKLMYRALIAAAQEQALPVTTRTWSTNHSHLSILRTLGFREVLRLRDARGEGIDTVYYKLGGM